ncbi:MAG: hypothetical protein Q8N94_04275 [Methanoregula sp.]|nr:hypothetical protein [Methanoregula sp.]
MTIDSAPSSSHLLHNRPRQLPLHSRPLPQPHLQCIAQRHQRINLRDDAVLLRKWGEGVITRLTLRQKYREDLPLRFLQ